MTKPPIGKSQIIQLWCSRNCVTFSNVIKKNAETEPEKTPIKTQMRIHLRVRRKVFFRFILDLFLHLTGFKKLSGVIEVNYSVAIAVNSISTKYSGATNLLTS